MEREFSVCLPKTPAFIPPQRLIVNCLNGWSPLNPSIYISTSYFEASQNPPFSLSLFPSHHLPSFFSFSQYFYSTMIPTREINGIRPSPLKIHTDSSLIKKPAGLSAIASSIPSSVSSASHRQPVIIYTHSPKIIHTQASEFMFLVQKLTGFSGSSNDDNDSSILPSPNNDRTPIASKRRKTSIGKQKDDSIKSSTKDTLQLVPQQWPSVAPTTTDLEFNPLHQDASSFMQGLSSEFFDWPNSSYKCTELPRISSMSNFNSSSPRFSDI